MQEHGESSNAGRYNGNGTETNSVPFESGNFTDAPLLDLDYIESLGDWQGLDADDWQDVGFAFPSERDNIVKEDETGTTTSSTRGGGGRPSTLARQYYPPSIKKKGKRARRDSMMSQGSDAATMASSRDLFTPEIRKRALEQLASSGWHKDGDLALVEDMECEPCHCFAMQPMGPDPRGYFGEKMPQETFEIRTFKPPSSRQRLDFGDIPMNSQVIERPTGRSLHMLIAKLPLMESNRSLESGFSLLVVRQRGQEEENWSVLNLAIFTGEDSKRGARNEPRFTANLDRCTNAEHNKRIWGQRTSHVKHNNDAAKPMKLEPRGATKYFTEERQFQIVIALFTPHGDLLHDVEGNCCIAQSNPFVFKDQNNTLASGVQRVLRDFEALTLSEKIAMTVSCSSEDAARLALNNSAETQAATGIFVTSRSRTLPLTACSLGSFQPAPEAPQPEDFLSRFKSVCQYLGHLHANEDLLDDNLRYSDNPSHRGAMLRFNNLYYGGKLQEHQDWLAEHGATLDIREISIRVQILESILQQRRFRSHFIVAVGNVYPDEIMVDKEDSTKVYCLYERSGSNEIEVVDRMYPLARLAYCSRLPRSYLEEYMLEPYTQGYESRKKASTTTTKYNNSEPTLDKDRFWLILHSCFLDYYLYWTEHRNPLSCRRIQQRLLEDDKMLDQKYFAPHQMKPFTVTVAT